MVIETTSNSTRVKDTEEKPLIYAKLGIREDSMHDPTSEYVEPPLQGHRLRNGECQAIAADSTGGSFCEELGLVLRISDDELNFFDPTSNQRVLTNSELAAAEAEARQIEVEARRRAEAEVERLKAELARLQRPDHC